MAKDVSPQEETTGKLSAAYYVSVSVDEKGQIPGTAAALEPSLRRAVRESYPGEAGCAVLQAVINEPPPAGSGYMGWNVGVTAVIDLTAWRRDVGPTNGQHAAATVRDLLADADVAASGARIDAVELQLLMHAPL
ncbi:hypothetical protein [Streptomyces sp. MH60]|uniref:hypothetical protein n=1 Tax=Streptomyces sp. MH60 TaxID=1940758 RepID=UPI000CEE6950|nr:hypothetical protein [Streptomyces sp. MH60]PPS89429.1 hypothetical protein BZZ08_01575 [Streptomyces sp. MH60]